MTILETARLRLEPVCPAHYAGLRVLNADPAVGESLREYRYHTRRDATSTAATTAG